MDKELEKDLDKCEKLYASIVFGMDDIEGFVDDVRFKERKFVRLIPLLRKYIEMGKNARAEDKQQNFFQKAMNINNEDEESAAEFGIKHKKDFKQLEACAECKCLNCISDCIMEGCNRCDKSGRVASCDKKKACVWTFSEYYIPLTDNNTGREGSGNVKAVIQDKEYNQLFIIFDFLGQQYVQYLYPKTTGQEYGTIEDTEDFNFALDAFEKINL
ncbi:MAG: hypothetical protein ACM3X7_00205 [Solirubrobacterales bacterium]